MATVTARQITVAINEAMEAGRNTIPFEVKCQVEACTLPMLTKRFCGGCKKCIHDACNFAEKTDAEEIIGNRENTDILYCCSAACLRKTLGIVEPTVVPSTGNSTTGHVPISGNAPPVPGTEPEESPPIAAEAEAVALDVQDVAVTSDVMEVEVEVEDDDGPNDGV